LRVRRSVSLLIIAGLLPIVGLGGTFGAISFRNERRAVEQEARTDAHFAAALLDVKLRTSVQAVQMVAQSPALDAPQPNLAWFRTLAARIVASQPDWRTVTIADTAGNRLLDVPEPIGGKQQGRVVEMSSFRRAVATGRPQIGDVVQGPKRGLAFAVRAPVIKAGQVRFVVSAVVTAARLKELLLFQPLPDGWRAAIIDARGRAVTASSPSTFVADKSQSVESWASVGATGWRVQVTTPARAFSAPVRNAALSLSAAVALCMVLLLLLARLLITELKQARQREAAQLQSQRMEALGRLTGGVAHDFNNLLTPIVGGLDLIGRRVSDERTLRYVEAAAASAERARTLVSRLLSFSRRQTLAPEPVDLHRLLHGMSDLIDRSLTPAIQCEVSVSSNLCPVHADRGQLELAILNLIINARDAMPDGGSVRITAGTASREQATELPGNASVFVAVTDNGIGMDASTMAQATEPFFTTKATERGTGLGLSMVHGFAAQSGGSFHLASTPNCGTVATIVLPCSTDTSAERATAVEVSPTAPARILLVDDEPEVRRVTADMLTDAGHDVQEASGVPEALAVLRADPTIKLVITDYVMPAQSGGDLINEMRANGPDLPVLLVTGYVTAGHELPHDVPKLMKPFSRPELLRALVRLVPTEHSGRYDG
jgi:signal transduction histidine kinase